MIKNYLFETCRGFNCSKLLRKLCILLVFLTHVYLDVWFRKLKKKMLGLLALKHVIVWQPLW